MTSGAAAPRKRYAAYAGFITTPRYFDDSPQQFLAVAPKGVGVIQRVLSIPDYAYRLDQRAANLDQLEDAATCLAESHAAVIGQAGTNWVHCNGTSPDEISDLSARIGKSCGADFVMAGMAIVEGLNALGARRITVANGYYREDWKAGINRFLEQAGFEILWAGNLVDQGIYADLAEMEAVEVATHWDYPTRDVVQACCRAHESAPDADAVVQTGSGFRVAPYIDAIEGMVGKPVVASDAVLYWAMLKRLDLGIPVRGHGRLLASLA